MGCVVCSVLFVVCIFACVSGGWPFVVCCVLCVVCCAFWDSCCLFVCCVMCVVCCLLFVVRLLLCVWYYFELLVVR